VKDLYKDYQKDGGDQTLQAFANSCPMKGQKLIACDMLSLFNDRWFGQWLALRQPFRDLEKLLDAEVVEKATYLEIRQGPKTVVHNVRRVLACRHCVCKWF
jgi:hypothetical protein